MKRQLNEEDCVAALLIKSCAIYTQKSTEHIDIMLDMICESEFTIQEIQKAFEIHFKENQFFPTISDILTRCSKPQEDDFLTRFRRQGYSNYDEHVVDDDVYTIRQLIGRTRMSSALIKDIPWIEKEALERFRDLKAGFVLVKQNPALDRIVKIGTAGSYAMLPQSTIQNSLTEIVAKVIPTIKSSTQIASYVFVELKRIEPSITFDYCCDCIDSNTTELFNDLFILAMKERGGTLKTVVGLFSSLILDIRRGGDHFYDSDNGTYEQHTLIKEVAA